MHSVTSYRGASFSLLDGRAHYEVVIEAIRSAETSVWIATANIKEMMVQLGNRKYHSILAELDALSARGVELRLLHASLPSRPFRASFDSFPRLVEGGLEMAMCPRTHFKAIIVDGRFIYLGSANFTGAGLGAKGEHKRNFELGIISEDEALLDEVQAYFDRIWRGGECGACMLRDACESPLDE